MFLIAKYIYVFLVMWIIPLYPHYKRAFHCGWTHLLKAILATLIIVLFGVAILPAEKERILLFLPLLAAAAWVDMRDGEIPDATVTIMLFIGINEPSNLHNIILAVFSFIMLIFALRGNLGFGDVKLMTMMSLCDGTSAFAAFAIASAACLIYAKTKKKASDEMLPFAPFLCIGYVIMLMLPL